MRSRSISLRKAVLLVVVGILAVALCTFITGCGGKQESSSSAAPSTPSSSSSNSATNNPHEDFTVKNVKVDLDGLNAPKITCTITNNTKFIYKDASLTAKGTFTVKDNYGDDKTDTENLDVFCTASGNMTMPYLLPGDNSIEFITKDQDNIVAKYSNSKGDTQNYTLGDANSIQIEVRNGTPLDEQQYAVLDKNQYELSLDMSEEHGGKFVTGTITNKTDYKWKEVTVILVAVTKDGSFSKIEGNSSNTVAFRTTPLKVTYMKPGTTEQLSSSDYNNDLNVDHFEVMSVFVVKDTDK